MCETLAVILCIFYAAIHYGFYLFLYSGNEKVEQNARLRNKPLGDFNLTGMLSPDWRPETGHEFFAVEFMDKYPLF